MYYLPQPVPRLCSHNVNWYCEHKVSPGISSPAVAVKKGWKLISTFLVSIYLLLLRSSYIYYTLPLNAWQHFSSEPSMNSITQTIPEINFSKEASRQILGKLCKVLGPVSWELMYSTYSAATTKTTIFHTFKTITKNLEAQHKYTR